MKKCGNPERLILNEGIKERPILFSSEMVRAILDNRKTETRRVMRPQPTDFVVWDKFGYSCLTPPGYIEGRGVFPDGDGIKFFKSPYGVKGDRLYVREAFMIGKYSGELFYKADSNVRFPPKWKPSIHMPKKFSRIMLEIKEIGIERIQDITELGAINEGLSPLPNIMLARDRFVSLWRSLNEKRGFGWEKNSYVWVIKFQRI